MERRQRGKGERAVKSWRKGGEEKTGTVGFQVPTVESRAERPNPNHVQRLRDSKAQASYPKK